MRQNYIPKARQLLKFNISPIFCYRAKAVLSFDSTKYLKFIFITISLARSDHYATPCLYFTPQCRMTNAKCKNSLKYSKETNRVRLQGAQKRQKKWFALK